MKCPECGEEMYPTHGLSDERVWECDDCGTQTPYTPSRPKSEPEEQIHEDWYLDQQWEREI